MYRPYIMSQYNENDWYSFCVEGAQIHEFRTVIVEMIEWCKTNIGMEFEYWHVSNGSYHSYEREFHFYQPQYAIAFKLRFG